MTSNDCQGIYGVPTPSTAKSFLKDSPNAADNDLIILPFVSINI